MEKYPFYDIVLNSNTLKCIIYEYRYNYNTHYKNFKEKFTNFTQSHAVACGRRERKKLYYFRRNGIVFLTESSKSHAEIVKSNKSGWGLAIIQSGGNGYGEKSF